MADKTILVLSNEEYSSLMLMLGIALGHQELRGIMEVGLIDNLYEFNKQDDTSIYQSPGIDIIKESLNE